MYFLEAHMKTKIKNQQLCSFPLIHNFCPRKGLKDKDEYQNISYPKVVMRDYNTLLQYFNKFQYLRMTPTIFFPREAKLVLPQNSKFGT